MNYLLKGDFVECCDCFTICPCWVSDLPDEDHCSGLYLWSLGEGSTIGGVDVSGMHVAAATFHAVRAGGQAMFFIDVGNLGNAAKAQAESLLYEAFSGRLQGVGLTALAQLLGANLGYRAAGITSNFTNKKFSVEVNVGQQRIAKANGTDKIFKRNPAAMTLKETALGTSLGIDRATVTVQQMGDLTMDVAALPGGPLNFRGRSGMRTKFHYASSGHGPNGRVSK